MVVIVVNTAVLAMPYLEMSAKYQEYLETAGLVFSVIYNVEAVVKIGGLGKRYFDDAWNNFDLFIVIASNLGILVEKFTSLEVTNLIVVVRALRISRVFRLIRGQQAMRVLLSSLTILSSQILYFTTLFGLVLFIFAVLGMNLFHGVILQEHYNEYCNFRDIGRSFLLLLRCVTGEQWNLIMHELTFKGAYNGVQCVEY